MLAFTLAALTFTPTPLDLDRLTVERARALHGKPVVATFLVAMPLDYCKACTAVGAADLPDGAERGAVLRGRRFDIEEGTRVTVRGVMRVTDWPACFLDGRLVPAWTAVIVVEE